jgi:hypothetical protein
MVAGSAILECKSQLVSFFCLSKKAAAIVSGPQSELLCLGGKSGKMVWWKVGEDGGFGSGDALSGTSLSKTLGECGPTP